MRPRLPVNRFGPYRLIRQLDPVQGLERWIALHDRDDTDHVVYRFAPVHDSSERRRVIERVSAVAGVRHAHLLEVQAFSFDESGRMCLVAPYTGNQEGLVTIDDLLLRRDGHLEIAEVARGIEHLLEAIAVAQQAGLRAGPIATTSVLVDRRGSVCLELFGLSDDQSGDEVRSIAALAVRMLTGLEPSECPPDFSRIIGRGGKPWELWAARIMDPISGIDRAVDALAILPGRSPAPDARNISEGPRVQFGSMIRRFRRATTTASWTVNNDD